MSSAAGVSERRRASFASPSDELETHGLLFLAHAPQAQQLGAADVDVIGLSLPLDFSEGAGRSRARDGGEDSVVYGAAD